MENYDLKYLENENLQDALSRGLAETFQKKPAYPIEFLANWLSNYNKLSRSKKRILEERKNLENIKFEIEQKFCQELESKKEKENKKADNLRKHRNFFERLENSEFMEDVIDSQFCEEFRRVRFQIMLICF